MDKLELHRQMVQELIARKNSMQSQLNVLDDLAKRRVELSTGITLIDEELQKYYDSINVLTPKEVTSG